MITLNTILYEGNFRNFLKEDCWFFQFNSKYITEKLITINNLTSVDEFNLLVNNLKLNHNFNIIFVKDYEQEALKTFDLKMDNTSVGYVYSIPYFVDILEVKTPFIFNVSSDCCQIIHVNDEYFEKSIDVLSKDDGYLVTCLPWGQDWSLTGVPKELPQTVSCVGEWEQMHALNYSKDRAMKDFWCSDVFSDQVFIGNIDKLKKIDYNLPPVGRYRGPAYGGTNAFEARLSEYLAHNALFRLIFKTKELYYNHIT